MFKKYILEARELPILSMFEKNKKKVDDDRDSEQANQSKGQVHRNYLS